jgi:hypothetical protein
MGQNTNLTLDLAGLIGRHCKHIPQGASNPGQILGKAGIPFMLYFTSGFLCYCTGELNTKAFFCTPDGKLDEICRMIMGGEN